MLGDGKSLPLFSEDILNLDGRTYHHHYSTIFASQGIGEQRGNGTDWSNLANAQDCLFSSNTIDNLGLLFKFLDRMFSLVNLACIEIAVFNRLGEQSLKTW